MNLELSKEQYRVLMQLVFLGNWMVGANEIGPSKEPAFGEMEEYIFGRAGEFGQSDMLSGPNPSDKMMNMVFKHINNYDEFTFWEELASRFAERDLLRKYDRKTLLKLSQNELDMRREELVIWYLDIFEKHRLDAITLLAPLHV
jgi:hypothetical protein